VAAWIVHHTKTHRGFKQGAEGKPCAGQIQGREVEALFHDTVVLPK
jgi:hypothetical protein